MSTAILSSRFHISIPKAVRDKLLLQRGQEFALVRKGTGMLLMPVPELNDLAGIAKGACKAGYRDQKDRNC